MFVLNWLQDGTNDFLVKFADYIIYSRPGLTYSCNKIGNAKIRITGLILALPQIISIIIHLKFVFSKKATRIDETFSVDLTFDA